MYQRGICVEWDNPQKTIIRWDFYTWTYQDFHAAIQKTLAMFAADNRSINTPSILNLTNSGRIPIGVFLNSRIALDLMHEDGFTVVAGASGFARQLTQTFINFNPSARNRVLLADTVEDARRIIQCRLGGHCPD